MAGGEGTRLRPMTANQPKPLLPVANRPIMEHVLRLLKRHGFDETVVTVQFLASLVRTYFGDGDELGMHLSYATEETPLGTAGSVKNAESALRDDSFVVISGDALTDIDLTALVAAHRERQALVTVCLKRVPDSSGEVLLTPDGQGVDGRYVGFTISNHELCAVELAIQVAAATGGEATVLTIGPAEAVDQLRSALSLGCTAATHVETDPAVLGPADVAREIAAVVTDHQEAGRPHDLVLLGNDAADSGDFQVGIRLAYALGRPVVAGVNRVEIAEQTAVAHAEGSTGQDTYELPLPAVLTVLEGGVEPRYPTITGRMKAKKAKVEVVAPQAEPHGSGRVRLTLPPAQPSNVEVLGQGADTAGAVVDLLQKLGVAR